MTHDDLIPPSAEWFRHAYGNGVRLWENVKGKHLREMPDSFGCAPDHLFLVGECKRTLSDFRANAHKPDLIGNVRVFFTPPGLLDCEQIPDGWGWVEIQDNGDYYQRREPIPREMTKAMMWATLTLLGRLVRQGESSPSSHPTRGRRIASAASEWKTAIGALKEAGGQWTARDWRKMCPRDFPCKAAGMRPHWPALEAAGVVIDDSGTEPVYSVAP